ncbi:ZIP family metal transporter [bacterium]|nr:MAG: ZIP family metal transporter [bacterium]
MDLIYLILAIIIGSSISLAGGALLFTTKKRRSQAILIAMPFGAGALLAAAFFDLLPESFEMGDPQSLLLWTLGGFLLFFLLERFAGWFHHHHEHDSSAAHVSQRRLIVFGDMMHNAIDGVAIGAAFIVSPVTGIITTLAVSAHEIPKELGTFALLLSRGWKDKKVLLANVATAVATLITAITVYLLGSESHLQVAPLLAVTAGFFIYIAASDIIPDIHEQPQKQGTIQAMMLVVGIIFVGGLITLLHTTGLHGHEGHDNHEHHLEESRPVSGHHEEHVDEDRTH